MRILVTGGLGFVGLHLVRGLAETIPGAFIIAGDVSQPDSFVDKYLEPVHNHVGIIEMDVCDRKALQKIVHSTEVDTIVHAAAITPDDTQERERLDWILDVNLNGAMNAMLAAAQEQKVRQFLFISSNGVYGAIPPDAGLINEDAPLSLNILYTITKRSAEMLLERCAQITGKRMTAARISAIYGEMERPTGSRTRTSHVGRLAQAWKTGRHVKVSGAEVSRDWMYAGDCATAIGSLLIAPEWHYPVYNVGAGAPLSFGEIVNAFTRLGLQAEWVEDAAQAEIAMSPEQGRAVLNISRLKSETGFTPVLNPPDRLNEYLNQLTKQ